MMIKIVKSKQTITVSSSSFTVKKADVKKKAVKLDLKAGAKTKLSYTTSSSNVKVSGNKIVVKKGTPKGTYTVKIKAAASENYTAATKKIKVIVK